MNRAEIKGKSRTLAWVLTIAFGFALVMGPGPGIYLVNPDASDPNATFTVGSVPILYLWALFWFAVEAAIVVTAYRLLWKEDPADE
jgi:hypothetical protein